MAHGDDRFVNVRRILIFVYLCGILAYGPALASSSPAHFSDQLRAECRDLAARAIRRPYGWAWQDQLENEPGSKPTPVQMGPRATPAASLLLLFSGRLLNDPKLIEASRQSARGIAASIAPNGKLFTQPIFGATSGAHEAPAPLPDRAPNCAALALLCAQITDLQSQKEHASSSDKELAKYFSVAALRLTYWLIKQQSPNNNWPDLMPADAGTAAAEGQLGPPARAIRLDLSTYRDSTLALILAAKTLDQPDLPDKARRSLDALLRLRIPMGAIDGGLFPPVLSLSGDGSVAPGFPIGPSAPACRHAMQMLLAADALLGDARYTQALADAATATADRRRNDGSWSRDMARGETPPPAPASQPAVNEPAPATILLFDDSGPRAFGLPEVLAAAAQIQRVGRDRFVSQLATSQSSPVDARQQIEMTLAGLSDEPLSMSWPSDPEQRGIWLAKRSQIFDQIADPPPPRLSSYTQRLWLIFLRATLDQQR
jgi:hypothetical protein